MGTTNEVANEKAKQMANYYHFHKKIEKIFTTGFNPYFKYEKSSILNPNGETSIDSFYIIDKSWINLWKIYSAYDKAKEYFDKIETQEEKKLEKKLTNMCNNMILTGEIDNNKVINIPKMNNEKSGNIFSHKNFYQLSDFDCLVDEKTFNLFCNLCNCKFRNLSATKTREIKGKILDKMIYLIFEEQGKIKIFYQGMIEEEKGLLQLTLNFNDQKNKFRIIDRGFKNCDTYTFYELKRKKADDLINFYTNQGVVYLTEINVKYNGKFNKFSYKISNENLYIKYLKRDAKKNNINFSNVNKLKYVGLENVGATCYMNATLQCLINIDLLTRYFLTETNYNNIINNIESCELTSDYVEL